MPTELETTQLAKKACNYARDHIKLGQTQLETNSYGVEKKRAIWQAMTTLRQQSPLPTPLTIEDNPQLRALQRTAALCKQYGVGNCLEYSVLALEYVLKSDSNIDAEIYHIEGGDHVFVVLGRKQPSNPQNPSTWGNSAVVCDPWANSVYPASEMSSHIKNYIIIPTDNGRNYYNDVEAFNDCKHTLRPLPLLDTPSIKKAISSKGEAALLKMTFNAHKQRLHNQAQQYLRICQNMRIALLAELASNDPVLKALTKKISALESLLKEINPTEPSFTKDNYLSKTAALQAKIEQWDGALQRFTQLSIEERKMITSHPKQARILSLAGALSTPGRKMLQVKQVNSTPTPLTTSSKSKLMQRFSKVFQQGNCRTTTTTSLPTIALKVS